jgi:hypothetical protein
VDTDCHHLNEYFICKDVELEEGQVVEPGYEKECIHKPLWPLKPKEWVGTFVFSLIMMLSNVAGIGGGGVAIPLAMYFFNLSTKPAIAISSFSIMISTLARFLYNFNERHPEKPNCACIDYNMTNVMMPLTMMGSLIGAFFYLLFPDLVITIVLTLLLCILTMESGRKFLEIYRKENAAAEEKKKQEAQQTEMQSVAIQDPATMVPPTEMKLQEKLDSFRSRSSCPSVYIEGEIMHTVSQIPNL